MLFKALVALADFAITPATGIADIKSNPRFAASSHPAFLTPDSLP